MIEAGYSRRQQGEGRGNMRWGRIIGKRAKRGAKEEKKKQRVEKAESRGEGSKKKKRGRGREGNE